jgi:hypothetical protein
VAVVAAGCFARGSPPLLDTLVKPLPALVGIAAGYVLRRRGLADDRDGDFLFVVIINRQDTFGLGPEKLPPDHRRPLRGRIAPGTLEDGPDGAGTDAVAQSAQLPMDSAVAPGRVLPSQSQHQAADLRFDRWPAASTRIRPPAADQVRCQRSGVPGCTNNPSHNRRGSSCARPASTARSAQSTPGPSDLPPQHRHLVAQHQKLNVALDSPLRV